MTDHRLSLARSPRVPRSLDRLIARATAPETDQTPNVDPVLAATTADALRQLQQTVEALRHEVDKWKRRVTGLEAREKV